MIFRRFFSNVANLRVAVVFATLFIVSSRLYADQCSVSGVEAVHEARALGVLTHVTRASDLSCTLSANGVSVSAVNPPGKQGECEVSFFPGMRLIEPWKYAGLRFSGNHYAKRTAPSRGSTDLSTVVVLTPPQGGITSLVLTTLVLDGPDCSSWTDAFGQ